MENFFHIQTTATKVGPYHFIRLRLKMNDNRQKDDTTIYDEHQWLCLRVFKINAAMLSDWCFLFIYSGFIAVIALCFDNLRYLFIFRYINIVVSFYCAMHCL